MVPAKSPFVLALSVRLALSYTFIVRINSARPRRGSNTFAYSSYCALLDPTIYGFKHSSNGTLTALNILPSMPQGSPNNEGYCPFKAAPDTTNHVAIPVSALYNHVWQLAVYTLDASGNLTTNSTSSNMPKVSVGVNDVSASPSGKYLAVGGISGLQIFQRRKRSAHPITYRRRNT